MAGNTAQLYPRIWSIIAWENISSQSGCVGYVFSLHKVDVAYSDLIRSALYHQHCPYSPNKLTAIVQQGSDSYEALCYYNITETTFSHGGSIQMQRFHFLLYNRVMILLLQACSAGLWVQVRLDQIIFQTTRGGRWLNRSSHIYHGDLSGTEEFLWGPFGGMTGGVR